MKKTIAIFLAVMMVFGAMFAITASAAVTGIGFTVAPEMDGIDWETVSVGGIYDYAMLCAYNGGKDAAFDANYEGAKANGIHVGAYSVMQATTVEEATAEAGELLKVLAGKQFEYPIYVQVTEEVYGSMTAAQINELVKAQMTVLEATRCFAGVYVKADFAQTNMDMSELENAYTTWVSDVDQTVTNTDTAAPEYDHAYAMWEYDVTEVKGVDGLVGLNLAYMYNGFPQVMINANLNGYGTSEIVAPADPVEPPVDDPVNPGVPVDPEDPVTDTNTPDDTVTDTNTPTDTDVPTPTDVVLGDVNFDGKIDAKDALQILKYAVKKAEFTDIQKVAAEVDGKEGINAKDALQILKFAVKIITKFPIEA